MSHTLNALSGSKMVPVSLTIINYTVGGEAVTVTELGAVSIAGVILGTVPPGSNSLAVALFPLLSGGKIMLFHFVSGVPTEIPTTTALNAVIPAVVFETPDPSLTSLYP